MAYHKEKRIVRLIDSSMCVGINEWADENGLPNPCRFCVISNVKNDHGAVNRMIHCHRLDCDNWDYRSFNNGESAEIIE